MQTRITARRFEIPDALREHIERSVNKLDRYFDGIHDVHVVLDGHDSNGEGKLAEVTIAVPRGLFRAQHTAASHKDAVSGCVRQLRRQVLRHKEKLKATNQDRHR